MELMRAFGMEPRIDPAENIFGLHPGSDQNLKPILFGRLTLPWDYFPLAP
jgi:hypothetical protein